MRQFIFFLFILGAQIGRAQDSTQTNIPVHDPVMIRQDGVYYVFATGRGISMWLAMSKSSPGSHSGHFGMVLNS